ncbi:MAG: thiamine phosphate synthase [Rikenellaceae bacterium]|jgi:thiamine-phosphate pyrophosphorylase|nr:thiamine phosphate synthase [Rikenellaceae bacterium]
MGTVQRPAIAPLLLVTQRPEQGAILAEARAFFEGGGRWVQLRMKEAAAEEIVRVAEALRKLCGDYDAILSINDNPQVAKRVGAHGVHLGRNDTPPAEARALLGQAALIGATANTAEDVRRLSSIDIDYIGLGPYRFTTTKKGLSPVLGIAGYEAILAGTASLPFLKPILAIGGIGPDDIPLLQAVGIERFAVSGAIANASCPTAATAEFLEKIIRRK